MSPRPHSKCNCPSVKVRTYKVLAPFADLHQSRKRVRQLMADCECRARGQSSPPEAKRQQPAIAVTSRPHVRTLRRKRPPRAARGQARNHQSHLPESAAVCVAGARAQIASSAPITTGHSAAHSPAMETTSANPPGIADGNSDPGYRDRSRCHREPGKRSRPGGGGASLSWPGHRRRGISGSGASDSAVPTAANVARLPAKPSPRGAFIAAFANAPPVNGKPARPSAITAAGSKHQPQAVRARQPPPRRWRGTARP